MILPFAVVGIVKTVMPDMAYSARYYFQGNRQSHFQIYTVSHTGVGRKQITNNKFNSYAPMWIDRDHLAWVEVYQPLPMSKPDEEPKAKMRVIAYDMRSEKRKKVAEIPIHEFFYPPNASSNQFVVYNHGPNSTLIETTFKVTMKGITKVPNKEAEFIDGTEFGEATSDDTLYPSRRVAISTKMNKWHLTWKIEQPNVSSEDDETVNKNWVIIKSGWKGNTTQFRLHGNKVKQAFVDASGNPIIHTVYAYEKYRHDDYVYRFSKDFAKPVEVTKRVGLVSLVKDRHLWVGRQPNLREGAMQKLDDGRCVYVSWLYVGDWVSGKQWTVADGLVYVEECAFRPKAH